MALRRDEDFRHQLIAAYHAGFYSQTFKDYPKLPPVWLRPSGEPEAPMSVEQMQANLLAWDAVTKHAATPPSGPPPSGSGSPRDPAEAASKT